MKIENPYSLGERVELLAYECIRGTFGDARKREKALGEMYRPVQKRVNEIYHIKKIKEGNEGIGKHINKF